MQLNIKDIQNEINDKTILITGGTGTFGNNLIEIISKFCKPKKVIIFSRDEFKQYHMAKKFPDNIYPYIRFFIGDIRDKERLSFALIGVDIVFHAAALKHVPIIEYNPTEAIKTNIYGTENVIEMAIKCGVKKVIALSTDKCVAPANLYGATKMCLEKLIIAANAYSGHKTKFSVLRYGNVFASRGSVVPLFLEQKDKGIITITDEKMTRFTLTIEDAITFVLNCTTEMIGGEVFVPRLPSYNIMQLANVIAPDCEKKIVGIRPGEKLHESMISENESYNSIECFDKYVILPSICDNLLKNKYMEKYGNNFCEEGFIYSSGNNVLIDNNKLKEMLL